MKNSMLKNIVSSKSTPCRGDTLVIDALKQMETDQISSTVVVDECHRPIGIFTEHDTLKIFSTYNPSAVKLSEVMTQGVFSMDAGTFVHDAYLAMEEKRYRHIVVTEEDGRYLGVVSEGDFLRHMGFEHLAKFKRVEDVMGGMPLLAGKDATIADSAALMREAGKDYVVILENQTPYGVVNERDIARYCIHGDNRQSDLVSMLAHTDMTLVRRSAPLQEAAILMQEHGVHQLIVVEDQNRFIGVLDRHDILKAMHGAYFEFLITTIEQKSDALEKLSLKERELTAEKEIAEQNMLKFRTLFESQPDGCALLDTNTVAVEYNQAICRMLGYTPEEFSTLHISDYEVLESAEETERRIKKIIKEGHDSFESRHRRKDGTIIDVWVNAVAMQIAEEPYFMVMYRDISDRKQKEDEIRRVQELAHIGTWEWDITEDAFTGSDECFRMYGLPLGQTVSIADVRQRVFIDDREWFEQEITRVLWEGNYNTVYRVMGENAELRWIQSHAQFQFDGNGKRIKGIGIVQDLTDRIRYEEELKQKDSDLGTAQALAHIGSWRLDIRRNLLEWSDETYRIFGKEIGTPLTYESFISAVHPEDAEIVKAAWEAALHGSTYTVEHRIVVNGETKWVREYAQLETDANGELLSGVGTVQVITERKLYEKQLETLANYDLLTGLANRFLLLAHLQKSIEAASRNKTMTALFMFDLDRFKDINDSFGHGAGDELLQQVAQRFVRRLREGDLIARLGGDEFAIVLEDISHPDDAGRIAEEMIGALLSPYKLQSGAEIHIGTSAGIVLFPQHGNEAEKLLQYADAALYKAKAEGRGSYRYYTDDLTDSARKRVECEVQLRRAIEKGEFEVYYQPQVHIASGRIVGAEALVRWMDPERGIISPTLFIPLAEETGMIGAIGEWVLNETCEQGRKWLEQGHRLTLAVNLSAHQVRHQNIPAMVEKALKSSGYPADRLELELTESALMQREEETVAMLHALRAQGIRLAIDDFGTGYSSLSYLKRFPIDVLKIDKSFIDDVPYERDDMAIVTAIIAMGQALGFQVLAEGVEQEEQLSFLKEKGCTMYQGYFKSPPLPAEEFAKLLQ